MLYGDGIHVSNFSIPAVSFSDHLPLICDFEIAAQGGGRSPLRLMTPSRHWRRTNRRRHLLVDLRQGRRFDNTLSQEVLDELAGHPGDA